MSRSKKPAVKQLQAQLLDWFSRHQRAMPWRAAGGRRPDPYHVWLSEIMLQQTTVVTVGPYFMKFIGKWPTVAALAQAKLDEVLTAWAGLGYYARARNLHKCAVTVMREQGGRFPQTVDGLLALPGIGPYTAAAIASIAFDQPAVAVDGNVERVISRFFAVQEPLPLSKGKLREKAAQLAKDNARPGDFTQAFMELGATVCTPRRPKCVLCPWQRDCAARKAGIAEELPRKLAKAAKPVRYGKVFWIRNRQGRFLIHKRTGQGLYEGMYQLPTTDWVNDKATVRSLVPPLRVSALQSLGAEVRHSFTHFDLHLEIWIGEGRVRPEIPHPAWILPKELDDYALPTLMKKAIRLCVNEKIPRKT
jgi:A/G-specific adenine glycosylase